jgi:hypothetical protein
VHLWTRRTSERGRLALAGVFSVALGGFVIGLAAVASADTTSTITYRAVGSDPSVCTSAPDVARLTIAFGTSIRLVNLTGSPVIVDTGGKKTQSLTVGQGVNVRLSAGVHDVRLVPDCVVIGAVVASTVDVLKNQMPQTPSGGPTDGPTGTPSATASVTPSWTSPQVMSTPPLATTSALPTLDGGVVPSMGGTDLPADATSLTSLNAGGPPDASPVGGGGIGTDDFGPPFALTDENDHKGVQLVGVVALICILGVSVGIIRVIRAQRASAVLERLT